MILDNFLTRYSLVFCLFKKPIMKLGDDGFFHEIGRERGILVKSERVAGDTWYHKPEDYLIWKPHLNN